MSMRKFVAWRKKGKGNKGESTPTASESLEAAKKAYEKATHAVDAAKLAVTTEGANAFELYGNLSSNEARQPWDKILQAQVTKCPRKTSTESLMMKLLPKPGAPSSSASQYIYSRCSDMMRAKPSNITLRTC